jgi:hypothetical protein
MNMGQLPAQTTAIGCNKHDRQVLLSYPGDLLDDQLSFPAEFEVAMGVIQKRGKSLTSCDDTEQSSCAITGHRAS